MAADVTPPAAPEARRVDRVAATGAIVALGACAMLPLAVFRANRIVNGIGHGLTSGGAAGLAMAALAALSLAAAFAPARRRPPLLLAGAAGLVSAWAWKPLVVYDGQSQQVSALVQQQERQLQQVALQAPPVRLEVSRPDEQIASVTPPVDDNGAEFVAVDVHMVS